MKDEIKEILENVKKCCDITKDQSFTVYQSQDILALLDYITNLQEENESLKIDNKRLQHNEKVFKSRNKKAIDYINNLSNEPNVFGHYGIDGNCKKYLLNILQGEDKENLYKYTHEKGFELVGDEDVKN